MAIYFKNGDVITDDDLVEIHSDPMAENACIKCGSFSNWGESHICSDCAKLYDYED